jgi:NAD(P)-dependent dehydrogenase (short-subunit alcohol dehydrogenase family)
MMGVTDTDRRRDRVALVTGANKGIGFATAVGLGRLGIIVLIGARDEGRGKEACRASSTTASTPESCAST